MAGTAWQVSGEYFEACSCDYVCPCMPTNLAGRPTHGHCDVGMAFHIDRGRFDQLSLDGLNFAVVAHTPGVMGEGNWSVGLIVDERANQAQRDAIVAIGSGQAGGPMAALGPLISTFLGVEARPIQFQKEGLRRSVSIPGVLDLAMEAVPSAANPTEPLYIDNTLHPANSRLALGRAQRSHLHAFALNWDDTSGKNNGHFAPFNWRG